VDRRAPADDEARTGGVAAGATMSSQPTWSGGGARLLRYRRDRQRRCAPILPVCSLINRPCVLDLLLGCGVVRRLRDGGHDVWLLDWGAPSRRAAQCSLGGYAFDVCGAAQFVFARRRVRPTAPPRLLHGGMMPLAAIAARGVPRGHATPSS
jgi:poly(3-hydroxyalkanoate) synthetase